MHEISQSSKINVVPELLTVIVIYPPRIHKGCRNKVHLLSFQYPSLVMTTHTSMELTMCGSPTSQLVNVTVFPSTDLKNTFLDSPIQALYLYPPAAVFMIVVRFSSLSISARLV